MFHIHLECALAADHVLRINRCSPELFNILCSLGTYLIREEKSGIGLVGSAVTDVSGIVSEPKT